MLPKKTFLLKLVITAILFTLFFLPLNPSENCTPIGTFGDYICQTTQSANYSIRSIIKEHSGVSSNYQILVLSLITQLILSYLAATVLSGGIYFLLKILAKETTQK
jgi:hypothetical protein